MTTSKGNNTAYREERAVYDAILSSHFPGHPVLPGVCTVRMVVRQAELVTGYRLKLMGINSAKFTSAIEPDVIEALEYDFSSIQESNGIITFRCTVKTEQRIYAKLSLRCEAERAQDYCRQRLRSRGICVIVPTYNNVGTVADVVTRCKRMCHDVIVVNDGCTDGTAEVLDGIEGISVVTLTKNSGKGCALRAGFKRAKQMGFAYAITLDADGQHYPEDIPLLLQANIEHPHSMIVGSRQELDKQERSGGSKFANAFANFWFCVQTTRHLHDTQTGYRLYPLNNLYGLPLLTSRYEAELELLVFASWHGVKIVEQPLRVYYPPKEQRVSHFRPLQDFSRIFVLNTLLCFMAIIYALPLALLRHLRTAIYTIYSLLFFLAGTLLVLLPLSALFALTTRNKERRTWKQHRLMYWLGRLVMVRHGIPGVKCSIENPHGEDFRRPAVVISNHQSPLDLMAMLALSPYISLLTKDWVWRSPFFGFAVRSTEYYPVSMGIDTLMPHLQQLTERNYSIAVYPEGTRSTDGRIGRFHQGAFRIARELHLDIIPVVEYAPGRCLPKGGRYLRRGIFHVTIDRRIPYEEYSALGDDMATARWFRKYFTKRYEDIRDKLDQ